MKTHDPIKEFAAKQLGIPVDQVTAEQRKQFKAIAYMHLYSAPIPMRQLKDKP